MSLDSLPCFMKSVCHKKNFLYLYITLFSQNKTGSKRWRRSCTVSLLFHSLIAADSKERKDLLSEWRKCQELGWSNSQVRDLSTAESPLFLCVNDIFNTIIFRYVDKCKFPKDGSAPKSLRYIGRYEIFWSTKYYLKLSFFQYVTHICRHSLIC